MCAAVRRSVVERSWPGSRDRFWKLGRAGGGDGGGSLPFGLRQPEHDRADPDEWEREDRVGGKRRGRGPADGERQHEQRRHPDRRDARAPEADGQQQLAEVGAGDRARNDHGDGDAPSTRSKSACIGARLISSPTISTKTRRTPALGGQANHADDRKRATKPREQRPLRSQKMNDSDDHRHSKRQAKSSTSAQAVWCPGLKNKACKTASFFLSTSLSRLLVDP
jgi:hypothetical protein